MNSVYCLRSAMVGIMLVIEGIRDLKENRVGVIVPAVNAVLAVVFWLLFKDMGIPGILLALAEGLFVVFLSFLTKEGIGLGDGIILCSTGLMLGWKNNFLMIFLACFISALTSIVLMIFAKADRKTKLPFVPFMIPALAITLFLEMIQ